MIRLDETMLLDLFRQAEASPRGRSHCLLHDGHDDPVQRLAIALRRGSYIRPHVHSLQWEMLVLVRGAVDVLLFTSTGEIAERASMTQHGVSVMHIPAGQPHGAVVKKDNSVVIEVKPGPYRPNEFMDWAPAEGAAEAKAFMNWTERAATGVAWPR